VEAVNGIVQSLDGRPVIAGCGTLSPVDDDKPTTRTIDAGNHARVKHSKQSTANRFAVLNGFVDCSMHRLTKAEVTAWLILYRDTRNGTACTSQADIARRAGLSVRSVTNAIRKLTESGLLVVLFQGGLNRGPSRYRVEPLMKRTSDVLVQKGVPN
jgi:DNA-binding transcriptional ArsR family regulator